jgi:hypothetical protein
MTPETYAHVSNLLIPTATVIYALAMVSHAMEWAVGRAVVAKTAEVADVAEVKEQVLVASDGGQVIGGSTGSSATDDVEEASPASTERMDTASRIGLLLTWLAFVLHLGGVVTRGLAAGRVPWGNMYEFSITASLAVAIVYLIFVQRYKLPPYSGLRRWRCTPRPARWCRPCIRTGSSSTCPRPRSPVVRSPSAGWCLSST